MNIKQKLITILLCAGLIPTVAVGAVAYVTISNQLRTNASSQLASIAIKQQQTLENLLQNKQEFVSQIANNYNLQVVLTGYATNKDASDLAAINTVINNEQLADPTDIQSITVANPNGIIFTSTVDGSNGQKLPASIVSQINSGNDNAITISQDPSDGLDKLNITTGISVNNQITDIVNVTWTMTDIVAAVQDYTGLGKTGETIVAAKDAQGNAISLFPLRFNTNAALSTNLNSLRLFDTNPTTYSNVVDYRGQEVTVSVRPIGFANWVIATKMDNKEILAPIAQLRNSLITIILISLLLILAIAWYLALIYSRPILSIARTARLIGQGDLSARTETWQNDEVGTLGTSINAMGQNLSELVSRIEAQRNQLQIILDSITESIVAIDNNGRITNTNRSAAELIATSSKSLVGNRIQDMFRWTKDGKPFDIPYNKPGTTVYSDLQNMVSPNSIHFVKVIVSQIHSAYEHEQSETQAIVTIHDETKSRELEAMKVDFVSMAAHELRTPLAAIRGYMELVRYKEAQHLEQNGKNYINQALKSTKELAGLIDNLLDVTRIERGTLTLHMEVVDIAMNAYQAVQDARFSAEDKQLTLSYSGEQKGCFIIGDEVALHEIVNNLLSNAIKYTPENGKIEVTFSRQDNHFIVSVKDTGFGIPEAALPNLFTKFYRVHGGLSSGSKGTGLGLFISKSIADRHGGTISVTSKEGKGSTFTFRLPIPTQEQIDIFRKQNQSETMKVRRHHGWVTQNINRRG